MGALSALQRRLRAPGRGVRYFPVGGACCLPALAAGEPDAFQRAGWQRAASPRHADLLLVLGEPNARLAPVLARLAQQVPAPRRILVVGSCTRAPYARAAGWVATLEREPARLEGCPVEPAAVVRAAAELEARGPA